MNKRDLSRRQLALAAGSGLLVRGAGPAPSGQITARQVIERIQKQVAVPWRAETVDVFKAGDPDTTVKGIATTFMSTLNVLQRAAAAGKNLVITHEPTFWNHRDVTEHLASDPIYLRKQDFIRKNDLVIWRFHDHWHARKPDGIFLGFNKAMGWQEYQVGDNQMLYNLPPTTLEAVARELRDRLKLRSMRLIGDPRTRVSKLAQGTHDLSRIRAILANVDAIIVPEAREWASIEYARDLVTSGQKKGMILLAHESVEEPGMDECAKWLRTFITEVPVEFVPAGEPFWRTA
jgi:putative NIF3 family GTP cyclohydrolase 1 type 2